MSEHEGTVKCKLNIEVEFPASLLDGEFKCPVTVTHKTVGDVKKTDVQVKPEKVKDEPAQTNNT